MLLKIKGDFSEATILLKRRQVSTTSDSGVGQGTTSASAAWQATCLINARHARSPLGRPLRLRTNGTLEVWDLKWGAPLAAPKALATFIAEAQLQCCAVEPDGPTIVAGDGSGRVHFSRLQGMSH